MSFHLYFVPVNIARRIPREAQKTKRGALHW
jgi:hypothetical protein